MYTKIHLNSFHKRLLYIKIIFQELKVKTGKIIFRVKCLDGKEWQVSQQIRDVYLFSLSMVMVVVRTLRSRWLGLCLSGVDTFNLVWGAGGQGNIHLDQLRTQTDKNSVVRAWGEGDKGEQTPGHTHTHTCE